MDDEYWIMASIEGEKEREMELHLEFCDGCLKCNPKIRNPKTDLVS